MNTFSESYLAELKRIHKDKSRPNGFGGKIKKMGKLEDFMFYWMPKDCLDYGCGKGFLTAHLQESYPKTSFGHYDPAVEQWKDKPETTFDMVFSNDVLEHIEPAYIDNVLQEIDSYAKKFIWLRIDTQPARKFLTDGRNAHLIQEGETWWLEKIAKNIKKEVVYHEVTSKGKLDVALEDL